MAELHGKATRFAFTKIITRDVDGTVDFYDRILGLKVIRTIEVPELIEKVLAVPGQETGPSLIVYHEFDGPPLELGNAWGPIGFQVADVDAIYERALASGGQADMEPFNVNDIRVAMFRDPEGHLIEIIGAAGSAR